MYECICKHFLMYKCVYMVYVHRPTVEKCGQQPLHGLFTRLCYLRKYFCVTCAFAYVATHKRITHKAHTQKHVRTGAQVPLEQAYLWFCSYVQHLPKGPQRHSTRFLSFRLNLLPILAFADDHKQ